MGECSLARLGVSMRLTLEIFNAGVFRVKLYPEMKVGSLVFMEINEG